MLGYAKKYGKAAVVLVAYAATAIAIFFAYFASNSMYPERQVPEWGILIPLTFVILIGLIVLVAHLAGEVTWQPPVYRL